MCTQHERNDSAHMSHTLSANLALPLSTHHFPYFQFPSNFTRPFEQSSVSLTQKQKYVASKSFQYHLTFHFVTTFSHLQLMTCLLAKTASYGNTFAFTAHSHSRKYNSCTHANHISRSYKHYVQMT